MNKKICLISANCQGAYIKSLLEHHQDFSEDFKILFFVNYQNEKIPEENLKNAEILIYQPLSDKYGNLSERYLTEKVSKSTIRFRISYLTFPIYWPHFTQDPRNVNNSEYPFGQFPYGNKFILNMLRKGIEKEKILELLNTKEILKGLNIEKVIQDYISFQKNLEERRDQKLLDFIIEHFRKYKLFESYNHPSTFLAVYQVNDMLEKIGYRKLKDDEIPNGLDNFLQMFQDPIHPIIAEKLQLEFQADWETKYNIWFKPMKLLDYYISYIYWDTTVIGSPKDSTTCTNQGDFKKITVKDNDNNSKNYRIVNLKLFKDRLIGKQLVFIHIPKTGGLSIHKMLSKALFDVDNYKHYNSTLQLLQDYNRRLHIFISGHFFYDVYKILSKDLLIFTFLRNPIERVISAFEFMKAHPEVWLGKFAQGSLMEFLSNEFVKKSVCNLQIKLLGLEINFQYFYSKVVKKEITKEEYFELINNFTYMEISEKELERAKENLKNMFFFGFTETLSNDIRELFSKLGLECQKVLHENRTPNHVKKRDNYTSEEIRLIEEYNALDIELYNYAKKLKENEGF